MITVDLSHVHSERLCLQRPEESDLHDLYEIHAAPETNLYNPSGPMESLDEARKLLLSWRADWDADGFGYWCVRESCAGPVVGVDGLKLRDGEEGRFLNLYYRFSPRVWGRGYAREAAGLAVATADRVFPGVPALAVVRRDNIPSRRVVTGIGMTHLRETTLNGGPRMVFGFPAP